MPAIAYDRMTMDEGIGRAPTRFQPGESPFRAKGTLWLGFSAYADFHVGGGLAALRETLPPALREFFSQAFIAASWYDVMPVVQISQAIASMNLIGHMEQVRRMGVWHGEQDLNGVYKQLLKQSTPQAICRRFASIYSQLYNFGRAEIVAEQENKVEACAYGMPEPLAGWWMKASESYLHPILAAAGARASKMTWLPLQPDGERDGVRLVRCPSQTTWV